MYRVPIIAMSRSPIGKFNGSLTCYGATELGAKVLEDILFQLERLGITSKMINKVIVGQVCQAGVGQNPAKQIAIRSDLPDNIVAYTVNAVCASSLLALKIGVNEINNGYDIVIAGGVESMNNIPYLMNRKELVRRYEKVFGDHKVTEDLMGVPLIDGLVKDGLEDPFSHKLMIEIAEDLTKEQGYSREEIDKLTYELNKRAYEAQQKGTLNWHIKTIGGLSKDETVREPSREKIRSLKPVLRNGIITPASASKLADGAAFVVLASEEIVKKYGIKPLCYVERIYEIGTKPERFTEAQLALIKQYNIESDVYQLHTPFVPVLKFTVEKAKLPWDKVNLYGSAESFGHPLGATGLIQLIIVFNIMKTMELRSGYTSMCAGTGLGIGVSLKRFSLEINKR